MANPFPPIGGKRQSGREVEVLRVLADAAGDEGILFIHAAR
jgi:hypothetical protein